ncbi:unnamed protein product [Schistosoma margrebowiei]|uniref:Uncharacterized protein n=1 Tax=Schistosoma margrebowiei TaxID=48269 RepID=A0AA85A1C8_9TREM|nr:unnamed protein product [Schistosoma margrebowiei]
MSKSTSRNKVEKGKNINSSFIVQDVIPGKASESEWNELIEDDLAEKTCYDIAKDIVDETLSAIFQIYLKDQLIPFAVHQASLCLMQYIDLEFMSCDQGEPFINLNPEWFEDELAESSRIDSWAQGAISKTSYAKISDNLQPKNNHQALQRLQNSLIHKNEDVGENKAIRKEHTVGMSHSENLHQISIRQKKPQKLKNDFKKDHTRMLADQGDSIPQLTKQLKDSTFKSSIENVSMENISVKNDNTSKEYSLTRKKPMKPLIKPLPETMLQNKRINGSGKLVFDDEGNLLSVPKLYPANKRQDESFTTDSHSNGSDNNILGNKIPIQWRFVSESYCNSTTNNQFGIKMNSKLRTARSSISNSSNKVRTRNRSLDLTGATVTPDLIRLQKIKNACINLPNTIDMVDLVAGVTISDGEHLKVGQLTNEQFTSILNTNWNNLDEIPPAKVN